MTDQNVIDFHSGENSLIPKFIHARNEFIESFGLETYSRVGKDDQGDSTIISTWKGTIKHFRMIGALSKKEKPPKYYRWKRISLVRECGYIRVLDNGYYQFEFSEQIPSSIEKLACDIEFIKYDPDGLYTDIKSWYGHEHALRDANILPFKTGHWKRKVRSGRDGDHTWEIIKFPNDRLVYTVKKWDRDRLHYSLQETEPMTPVTYKDFLVETATLSLAVLLEHLKGGTKGADGMYLSNVDVLEEQISTLMDNIRKARVIRKPRLNIVS